MPSITFSLPPGVLLDYCGSAAPAGYLLCDGTAVSRTTYAALFAAIGIGFGAGNGTTTFNLPDCRGRVTMGSGTGSGLTARTFGANVGAETASHKHQWHKVSTTFGATWDSTGTEIAVQSGFYGAATGTNIDVSTGVNMPGNFYTETVAPSAVQPSLVTTKIIKI